jgi:hypothetical protein
MLFGQLTKCQPEQTYKAAKPRKFHAYNFRSSDSTMKDALNISAMGRSKAKKRESPHFTKYSEFP